MKIEDGARRVFINTRGKNKEGFTQEFLDFMEYITATRDEMADRAESGRIKLIHERVKKIRRSEKMGVKYMQFWEEKAYAREEGLEEGGAEGENRKLIQLVGRMLQRGSAPEDIADDFGENIDFVETIYQVAEKYAYDYEKVYAQLTDSRQECV